MRFLQKNKYWLVYSFLFSDPGEDRECDWNLLIGFCFDITQVCVLFSSCVSLKAKLTSFQKKTHFYKSKGVSNGKTQALRHLRSFLIVTNIEWDIHSRYLSSVFDPRGPGSYSQCGAAHTAGELGGKSHANPEVLSRCAWGFRLLWSISSLNFKLSTLHTS